MENPAYKGLQGWERVVAHFGHWPSFHDGEILRCSLNHMGDSALSVLTWTMTSDVDERGYYISKDHAVVHFSLHKLTRVDLFEFSSGSVIFGLKVRQDDGEHQIELDPCVGLSGTLRCQSVHVSIEAHPPSR